MSVQGRSKDGRLLQGLSFVLKRLTVEGMQEEAGAEEAGAEEAGAEEARATVEGGSNQAGKPKKAAAS